VSPPLGLIRVLDVSRDLPGRFCSALLAALGADVVAVAAPRDAADGSLLDQGKRSITLDVERAEGRDVLRRLAGWADVFLESYRPGVMARLGVDYEALRRVNPRLVYCAISGYGQDGPYRTKVGHDINFLGYAGVLEFIGEADGPPVLPGVQIAEIGGGALMAAVGILGALLARARTGRGQLVDMSILDGALIFNVYQHLLWTLKGTPQGRARTWLTGDYPCYAIYETGDGRHVTVGAFEPHFWATLCRCFGREDFIPEQWAEGEKREEIFAFCRARFRERTRDEWVRALADEEICFGPVNTVAEALADPQLRHRGMIAERETPAGPRMRLGCPVNLSDAPREALHPATRVGEHTDEVLREIGLDAAAIAHLRADAVV
jgi:crotonobetainyl-CoA:carnitine CoA-transferase CaiB-like acyl-CoA transferase